METMRCWQRESLSLPRWSHLFVFTRPRTLVPTWPTEFLIAILKKMDTFYQTKARRATGRDRINTLDVGLSPTKLLLRLTEQLQQIVSVEATFPSKALGAVQTADYAN